MKKNILIITSVLFFTFLFVLTNAQQRDVIWFEDFEGDWTQDWYAETGTWEVGSPTSGPDSAYAGQNCAATILDGNYHSNTSSRLIKYTSLDIPDQSENPRLRFWHWFLFQDGGNGRVQLKAVDSTYWIDISPIYSGASGGIWTYPLIDLSEYANQTVQIAFYFYANTYVYTNPGWYIDDVSLVTGPIQFYNPENFEFGIGDWGSERGTWEVGVPSSGPDSAYTGQNCAATVLDGNYFSETSTRLISPEFEIPDQSENPRLRFWHWFLFQDGGNGRVQLRVVDSTNWVDISPTYSGSSGEIWTYPLIDLSEYANHFVQIAFYFQANTYVYTNPGWYIDDIRFEGVISSGNKENVVETLNIYPNPLFNKATIEFDNPDCSNYKLSIFNISGNKVLEIDNIKSGKIEFERNDLPEGMYFIVLVSDEFKFIEKLIIR